MIQVSKFLRMMTIIAGGAGAQNLIHNQNNLYQKLLNQRLVSLILII